MNGKSCLMCGKPLGRIRGGGGGAGEFCSREHRNQYRLRRSMDCLTEANKVSTVARRRENLKPLAPGAQSAGVISPRSFHIPLQITGHDADRPALKHVTLEPPAASWKPKAGILPLTPEAKGSSTSRRGAGMKLELTQPPPLPAGRTKELLGRPRLNPARKYRV